MEVLEARRHSSISSIVNHDPIDHPNSSAPNMAAAALASPTSVYSANSSPFYAPGWPAPSTVVVSGLMSPPESRRTSDNKAEAPPPIQTALQQQRHSLPSLHEALSSGGNSNPYVSPISASLHHPQHYSQSQPQAIPRTYPPEQASYQQQQAPPQQPRLSSPPHPVHPQSTSFARPDPAPGSFVEASRHGSSSSLHAAPGSAPAQYTPRFEPLRHEPDLRTSPGGGYTHHPSPPQSASYSFGSGPPRHPQGYDEQPYASLEGREQTDKWKGAAEDGAPAFRVGLKRHLDNWDFEHNLAQVNHASGTVHEWSRHYNSIAQEQPRQVGVMPDRMPSLDSCKEMLEHAEKMITSIRRMQDTILAQKHAVADQRMREQGAKAMGEYDDDVVMYGDDRESQGFGGSEAKKRRGRAAPPGRCHSCNRAETPEWRRGPDGARTLCNACGLHYAKLTRKNTLKQSQVSSSGSSLRPKSMEGQHSPRR